MSRLPNASIASVEQRKVIEYLLSEAHPGGRAKAEFFHRVGFHAERWTEFRDAVIGHARDNEVTAEIETEFGRKYIVTGPMSTPSGQDSVVRAIWFIEQTESVPRLVTVYPLKGRA